MKPTPGRLYFCSPSGMITYLQILSPDEVIAVDCYISPNWSMFPEWKTLLSCADSATYIGHTKESFPHYVFARQCDPPPEAKAPQETLDLKTMTPPCANWSIWTGPEVEGCDVHAIGKTTLFVRSGDWQEHVTTVVSRIWFCKEFTDWDAVREAFAVFLYNVCVETTPSLIKRIPKDIRDHATLYMKLDVELKPGDHICVGPAFSDEAFQIGSGNKVTPYQYQQDKRLL